MFCLQRKTEMHDGEVVSIVLILSHSQVEEAAVPIPADGGASLSLSLTGLKGVFPGLLVCWFVL